MKTIILSFALFLLCTFSFAQSAADEKAVRAVIQTMDDAWNAHKYTYAGKYDIYDKDAVMINPVGMYWKNRTEIIQAHQVFGETIFKYESTKGELLDIRFLAPTVAMAIINAQYRIEQDFNLSDGRKGGVKGDVSQTMLNVILTKTNGTWKIASLQVTTVDQNAAAHNPVVKRASK